MKTIRFSHQFAAAIALLALATGCKKTPEQSEMPRPVRVMRLQDTAAFSNRSLPGRAKATQEVNLAIRVAGPLIELPVDVGSEVKQGDVVARIDPRDFQVSYRAAEANLEASRSQLKAMQIGARPEEVEQLRATLQQAEARLRTATNEFVRAERLVESRIITQSDFDDYTEDKIHAEAELRRAQEDLSIGQTGARPEDIEAKQAEIRSLESAVASAKNQWTDTTLRAPFDGVVVAKYVQNYEDVQAKQPIVRLLDASRIEMIVNVAEGSISLVPFVKDIECTFDAFPDLRLQAQVKEIGSEASQITRTYPVTLIMDQPTDVRILPGMAGHATGHAELPDDLAKQGAEIPESALFERDEKNYVWVIESTDGQLGTATLREVSLGELTARGLRNVQGLQSGDVIATAGVDYLSEGEVVRILDSQS